MTVELGSHLAGRKLSLEEAKQYVGQVHGGANSKEETAEYQKGNKRVIVGTIKKGGTGLSYHDRQGGRKRHQINLSLPLAGAEFQQVSGRSYRMGSQSDVDMVWLHGDDDFEKKVGGIVGRKLASMGALVEGNPAANVSAQDMLNWETAQASDLDEYAESVTAIETGKGDVEQAKDFFRESVQKLRDGTDVLEEVGVRVTGSRERTRDRRARLAVAQLGSIGIGVQKVGSGVKITGMPIGTEAYERVKEMYAPKPGAKKKAFNLAKYNAKDETWTIRDPNDVRKIAIKLDVAKREVSPVSGWDDATLAQAVAANANHHMTYKMSESTAGPFTRLLEQARQLTDQAEPTDQLDPHQFVSAQV